MSTTPSGFTPRPEVWSTSHPITTGELNRIEGNINAIETGNRTLDQVLAGRANVGTLRQILSWFAGLFRAITGATNWFDVPATTLVAAHTHHSTTQGVHGSVSTPTANTIMQRDAVGRTKVATPAAADDVARLDTVTTHAALTNTAHGAVSAPTVNTLMARDAAGRTKVVAPAVADDVARLDTVTAHTSLTNNPHAVTAAQIGAVRLSGDTMTGGLSTPVSAAQIEGAGGLGTIELRGNATMPAGLTFLRLGAFACNFGLDLDNQLKVGGWSMGAVKHRIWHEGNFTPALAPYVQDNTEVSVAGTVETARKSFRMVKHTANGINVRSISLAAEMWVSAASTGTLRLWRIGDGSPLLTVTTTATGATLVTAAPIDVSAWVDGIYNFEVRLFNSVAATTFNRFFELYVR